MSGKTVIEAENLTLELPNKKPLISNFSVTIQRGDKIGIIGKNGIGKTTLIEGLLGNLKPISGKIITGTKLSIAYFDQMRDVLKTNQSLLSTISEGRDFVTINGVRSMFHPIYKIFYLLLTNLESQLAHCPGEKK